MSSRFYFSNLDNIWFIILAFELRLINLVQGEEHIMNIRGFLRAVESLVQQVLRVETTKNWYHKAGVPVKSNVMAGQPDDRGEPPVGVGP